VDNKPDNIQNPIGVAIDLGTTYINASLCNLITGERLKETILSNPQISMGTDILHRLVAANENEKQAQWLQRVVIDAIGESITEITGKERKLLEAIEKVYIVGNTAMLSLMTGHNIKKLLKPESWLEPITCYPKAALEWADVWGLRKTTDIQVLQPLGGFVGSDLLAGLLYTKMDQLKEPALFIDFGTNSEITLWDGNKFWVTAAAGGPAFEGCGISCGMAALPGAVYCIDNTNKYDEWQYSVIGGKEPKGVCGSAMVDALALLLKTQALHPNGRIKEKNKEELSLPGLPLSLTHRDIDIFQRAKAAIAAGWETLYLEAGIKLDRLSTIYIGGAFGEYLNPNNAMSIGLLPLLSPERVKVLGNTALNGCLEIISCPEKNTLESIRNRTLLLNLAAIPTFEDRYFSNLFLQPV